MAVANSSCIVWVFLFETKVTISLNLPLSASGAWMPDGSHPSSAAIGDNLGKTQHPSSVEPPRSTYSSPSQQDGKVGNESVSGQQQRSPIRRPSSGPMSEEVVPQADGGQPHSAPPFSSSSSVAVSRRRASMTSNQNFSFNGQKLEAGKCSSLDGRTT